MADWLREYLAADSGNLQGGGGGPELRHPQAQARTAQRKSLPTQLRLVEGWPLAHYPIRPGATFLLDFNDQLHCSEPSDSTRPPVRSEGDLSDDEDPRRRSSSPSPSSPSRQLEEGLGRMLEACRGGDLELAARIIKEEPSGEGEESVRQREQFLLNEVGEEGRNALH